MKIPPFARRTAIGLRIASWPITLAFAGFALASDRLWLLWIALLIWLGIQLLAFVISLVVWGDEAPPNLPSMM